MSLFDEEITDHIDEDLSRPTLSDPQHMSLCLSHDENEQHLLKQINENTLPHALMFTGIKGIGKATFAHRLARFLLTYDANNDANQDSLFGDDLGSDTMPENMDVDPSNISANLYNNNAHPDCKVITRVFDEDKGRYKDAVDVGEIRKIAPFLRMSSSNGGWRVVVIDDADTMNRNAQNALLKVLEEPPSKTLLILITHRPGQLIPTIHSRAQRIAFSPLNSPDIKELLNMLEMPPRNAEIDKLIDLSHGSIGAAIDLIEEEGLASLENAAKIMQGYPSIDWEKTHKEIDVLVKATNDSAFRMTLKMLIKIMEILASTKARNKPLPNYLPENLSVYRDNHDLTALMQKSDDLSAHISKCLRANLDKKQTLMHAISLIMA